LQEKWVSTPTFFHARRAVIRASKDKSAARKAARVSSRDVLERGKFKRVIRAIK
jgi:hypothetical protein